MKRAALTVALLLTASPAMAQVATSNQGQAAAGASSNTSSPAPTVICDEEMTGTFCNAIGASTGAGFGLTSGAGGTLGSTAVPTPTPPCSDFPVPAELCD